MYINKKNNDIFKLNIQTGALNLNFKLSYAFLNLIASSHIIVLTQLYILLVYFASNK